MPTNEEEDLALRLSPDACVDIVQLMKECRQCLEKEFSTDNPNLRIVQRFLSDDLPSSLEDFPECMESLRSRDLSLLLDGSLSYEEIEETKQIPKHIRKMHCEFFEKRQHLEFRVPNFQSKDSEAVNIRWQVLNAKMSPERRGDLFEAKKNDGSPNSNKFVNHEMTLYDGKHWIKYYIYEKKSKQVVEIGKKFYVEVM